MAYERCQFPRCTKRWRFALFQLRPHGTKVWVHLCDKHDRQIASENMMLRRAYPDRTWREVPR